MPIIKDVYRNYVTVMILPLFCFLFYRSCVWTDKPVNYFLLLQLKNNDNFCSRGTVANVTGSEQESQVRILVSKTS